MGAAASAATYDSIEEALPSAPYQSEEDAKNEGYSRADIETWYEQNVLGHKAGIVQISVGSSGNRIGASFWEAICAEHGVDAAGAGAGPASYFNETSDGRFVPRSVLVHADKSGCDATVAGPLGKLFRPDNHVYGEATGGNWAKGFYTSGAEIVDACLDVVRREAEQCDRLAAFQVCHALGGGTGGGLGPLLLTKIAEEYPDRVLASFAVLPGSALSESPTQPYNAVLALHQLIELNNAQGAHAILFDADALAKTAGPEAAAARAMADATAPFRFPSALNWAPRAFYHALCPWTYGRRLHFLLAGAAPPGVSPAAALDHLYCETPERRDPANAVAAPPAYVAADDAFRRQILAAGLPVAQYDGDVKAATARVAALLAKSDARPASKLLAAALFARGPPSAADVEAELAARADAYVPTRAKLFDGWAPPPRAAAIGGAASSTAIANSTAVRQPLSRVCEQMTALFRKKAFVHNYTGEGMDEMEFCEAESNVNDLVQEYRQYEDAEAVLDPPEEEE